MLANGDKDTRELQEEIKVFCKFNKFLNTQSKMKTSAEIEDQNYKIQILQSRWKGNSKKKKHRLMRTSIFALKDKSNDRFFGIIFEQPPEYGIITKTEILCETIILWISVSLF